MGAAVRPYIAAGALALFALWSTGVYLKGRADGASVAEIRGAKATLDQLKERGLINEDVRNADDCDLLADIGVMCDQ